MDALALRATLPAMILTFQEAEASIRGAFALLAATEERMDAAFNLGGPSSMRVHAADCHHRHDWGRPDEAIAKLHRQAWSRIVERLELRRAMSHARFKSLMEQIDTGEDVPEITEENVAAFVAQNEGSLDEMFREAIAEVYEWLRPRDDGYSMRHYKTNQKNARLELGERIVITGIVERKDGGGFRVGYYDWQGQRATCLENVFTGLDGKGKRTKGHRSELENAIAASPDGHGRTEYFEFRAYKNRSLHLRFLRLDLLAKFNAIAGGLRLKPEAA